MYTIGDRVTINRQMTDNDNAPKTWTVIDIDPMEVVYLGTGHRWDGQPTWEYADEDTPYDRRTWVNTKYHRCYVCQPIDKGGRYRKSIAVPLDGIVTDS